MLTLKKNCSKRIRKVLSLERRALKIGLTMVESIGLERKVLHLPMMEQERSRKLQTAMPREMKAQDSLQQDLLLVSRTLLPVTWLAQQNGPSASAQKS